MNSIFKTSVLAPKTLGLIALFSGLNLLCMGCLQNEPLVPELHQSTETGMTQPQASIVASEPTDEGTRLASNTPSDSSAPIYRNEDFGIRFPYPEGVQVQTYESALSIWTADDYENIEDFIEVTPLLIEIKDNPDNLAAWEWLPSQSYPLDEAVEVEEQQVGGQNAVVFNWLGMWAYTSVAVAHPTRQKMIVITWDKEISDYQELFYDLLADLDFIH